MSPYPGGGLSGVPRTALFTLRARADEHQRPRGRRFEDPWAVSWLEQLGWPRELDRYYSGWIQGKNSARAAQIDVILRALTPELDVVVELGCGLSSRRHRLRNNFSGPWLNVDLPEICAVRRSLGAQTKGQRLSEGSALEDDWLDALGTFGATPPRTMLLAEGLFYYLEEASVRAALQRWRARLPGAVVAFDVIGALDLEAARGYSRRLQANILWAVPPPFDNAMHDLGLAPLEGFEPERLLESSLEQVSPLLRPALRGLSRLSFLRERRSGLMVGRLRP